MIRHVNNRFNALWREKYPYPKAQCLETAKTIDKLIDKLKKRNDTEGYHVFNWENGQQLL